MTLSMKEKKILYAYGEAIARQPEAAGKINSALLLGCALAEGTAIFGFITALLVIFMG